jgi:hypothetical protein
VKFWRLLTLPAYALSAPARFVWLALGVLIVAFGVFGSLLTHDDTLHWMLHAAHVWAALNAFLWVFLANTVLLARDARALPLPTLQRDALISLGLYAALGIALPTLLLTWAGGHLLAVAIILLFGAGLGAAFALLPTYLAVFALFADRIPVALSPWLPLPLQPGFNAWAGPLVVLLWLALAWRIHGLMRGKHSLQAPHGPMLMAFWRSNLGWGSGATANRWRPRTTWQGPTWARPTVDLRGCGPGHAECSLRMALGGWWMPQTWRSRAWQCVLLLAGLMVGALFLLVQTAADQRDHTAGLATGLGGAGSVVFFGTLVSALLTIATVRLLYRRWGKANAELPLLAVLPGLGGASAVKHALLRASLLPALGVQLALVLLLLIPAGSMHPGAAGEAVLLLGPLGSSGLMCAFALMVFGADLMRGWDMALATGAGYVWIGLSAGIVGLSAGSAVAVSDTALLVLAIGWSVFFVALLWLGRRGWRALQRQPHPFLVD